MMCERGTEVTQSPDRHAKGVPTINGAPSVRRAVWRSRGGAARLGSAREDGNIIAPTSQSSELRSSQETVSGKGAETDEGAKLYHFSKKLRAVFGF